MIYTVSANPALDMIVTVHAIEYEVVLRAYEVRREWGGKGFNVSRFLKALGVDNVAIAFAAGYTGRALEDGLNADGVATDFIYVEGETRTNVVIQEPEGRRHIKVNQPGAAIPPAGKAALLARAEQAQAGDTWILTGSLAPGLDSTFYAEVAQILHRCGAAVVLDTSGPALRAGCAAQPQLVKPNVVEAEEFTGRKITSLADAVSAAHAFIAAGAKMAILSLGKDGALGSDGFHNYYVRPPALRVKTAVGAGDALVTGAVWAMQRELPLLEMVRWGVTVGTVTAVHDDLAPNAWAELDSVYQQAHIEELNS